MNLYRRCILLVVLLCYTMSAMYAMRSFVLPAMSPHVVGGHLGGDPKYYHQLSVNIAKQIADDGLKIWELFPAGQGPVGIFSLVYVISKNSNSIIIINALLHVTACYYLYLLLRRFFTHKISILAVLPFALSPFQMYIFSQINKDSFVACGSMIFVYGLTRCVEEMLDGNPASRALRSCITMTAGAFLIYIGRPYVVLIFQLTITIIFSVTLVGYFFRAISQDDRAVRLLTMAGYLFCCFTMVMSLSPMTRGAASDNTISNLENAVLMDTSLSYLDGYPAAKRCLIDTINNWRPTSGVPVFVENKLKALCSQRCLYFMQLHDPNEATRQSVLDVRSQPKSVVEVFSYLPRATVVGLLTPLPGSWFMKYNGRFSSFYTMVALEVMLFYPCMAYLLYGLLSRRHPVMLVPTVACTVVLVIYGLGVPFVGALYRYRYPFWMILLCLGLGTVIARFKSRSLNPISSRQ